MTFLDEEHTRGAKPTIDNKDSFLITLYVLKTGSSYETTAIFFQITESQASRCVDRIRGPLETMLKQHWWSQRPRPTPLTNTNFPHIALLTDSTT